MWGWNRQMGLHAWLLPQPTLCPDGTSIAVELSLSSLPCSDLLQVLHTLSCEHPPRAGVRWQPRLLGPPLPWGFLLGSWCVTQQPLTTPSQPGHASAPRAMLLPSVHWGGRLGLHGVSPSFSQVRTDVIRQPCSPPKQLVSASFVLRQPARLVKAGHSLSPQSPAECQGVLLHLNPGTPHECLVCSPHALAAPHSFSVWALPAAATLS